jgi:hypothetical protein
MPVYADRSQNIQRIFGSLANAMFPDATKQVQASLYAAQRDNALADMDYRDAQTALAKQKYQGIQEYSDTLRKGPPSLGEIVAGVAQNTQANPDGSVTVPGVTLSPQAVQEYRRQLAAASAQGQVDPRDAGRGALLAEGPAIFGHGQTMADTFAGLGMVSGADNTGWGLQTKEAGLNSRNDADNRTSIQNNQLDNTTKVGIAKEGFANDRTIAGMRIAGDKDIAGMKTAGDKEIAIGKTKEGKPLDPNKRLEYEQAIAKEADATLLSVFPGADPKSFTPEVRRWAQQRLHENMQKTGNLADAQVGLVEDLRSGAERTGQSSGFFGLGAKPGTVDRKTAPAAKAPAAAKPKVDAGQTIYGPDGRAYRMGPDGKPVPIS